MTKNKEKRIGDSWDLVFFVFLFLLFFCGFLITAPAWARMFFGAWVMQQLLRDEIKLLKK